MEAGLVSAVPAFMLRFVMICDHRLAVVIAIVPVHRIALVMLARCFVPLMFAMFTRPALTLVIADCLVVLMFFESLVRVMMVDVFRRRAYRRR
jgi:hypothetical protein